MPPRKLLLAFIVATALPMTLPAQPPAAFTTDPAPDKASPAAFATFQLPSHGSLLNAFLYIAAGAGPHPTVLLLHGFPGNERNLDLAQTLRRAGYDVLYFDYRGSWGSPGDFSFTHAIEDTHAAIAFLRDPANAGRYRVDPTRLLLIGHSMGGMIAANVAATEPAIQATVLISAADIGGMGLAAHGQPVPAAIAPIAQALAAEGMAPLAGCTPESLARDAIANASTWAIPTLAPKLTAHPLLVITSDDGLAGSNDALVGMLRKLGDDHVSARHFATDHSYSDHRIALQQAILGFLAGLAGS